MEYLRVPSSNLGSPTNQVNNGDIIVFTLNGGLVCKKIDTKMQRLISSNKDSSTYQLREGEDFLVEGVVISSVRMHRECTKEL